MVAGWPSLTYSFDFQKMWYGKFLETDQISKQEYRVWHNKSRRLVVFSSEIEWKKVVVARGLNHCWDEWRNQSFSTQIKSVK